MQIKTRKRKPMEFSKQIAIVVLTVFVMTWLTAWGVYIIKGEVSTELLSYISTPLMVVISGYFTKAGIENVVKIKGNTEE